MINQHLVLAVLLISSYGLPITGKTSEDIVLYQPNLHVRTLAASCAACHGTHGNAVAGSAVLAGMNKAYFTTQMLAFRDGSRPATVMHRHAKGLQVAEINELAAYFAAQKIVAAKNPPSQALQANHD